MLSDSTTKRAPLNAAVDEPDRSGAAVEGAVDLLQRDERLDRLARRRAADEGEQEKDREQGTQTEREHRQGAGRGGSQADTLQTGTLT